MLIDPSNTFMLFYVNANSLIFRESIITKDGQLLHGKIKKERHVYGMLNAVWNARQELKKPEDAVLQIKHSIGPLLW